MLTEWWMVSVLQRDWRVLRFTSGMVKDGRALAALEEALKRQEA